MFTKGFLCGVLALCIVHINAAPSPQNNLSNAHAEGESGVLQHPGIEPSYEPSYYENSRTSAPSNTKVAHNDWTPPCCKHI